MRLKTSVTSIQNLLLLTIQLRRVMEKNRNLMIILTLLGLLFSYEINAGEQKNHCYDDDANMEWEALIQKYPDDRQIHALHALRIGLCFKVDRGDITVDEATERLVVHVVDKETGETVRQVPPKEMLRISAHLKPLQDMNDQVMSAVKSVILDMKY